MTHRLVAYPPSTHLAWFGAALLAAALGLVACSGDSRLPPEPSPSLVVVADSDATTQASASTLATVTPEITSSATPALADPPRNVLLLVFDDLGVDSAECYASAANVAPMPNLAALCQSGMVFDRVWSNPTCSPTRATMLTGRYGFRTGIGQPVSRNDVGLRSDEFTLPMALATEGVASANIGKWHLAGTAAASPNTQANDAGYQYYAGSPSGVLPDYEQWQRVVDGFAARETGYATSVNVDDALVWISQQNGQWFTWIGFNAPHDPLHLPPATLHSRDDLTGTASDLERRPREYFEAMVEALDTEIGRLLTSMDPAVFANTVVMVVGDNGTAQRVASGVPRGRAKDSLYQGGIHIPLIVSGPGVASGRSDALVNLTDVFPTVLDLAAVDRDVVVDGVSFVGALRGGLGSRSTLYSELFGSGVREGTSGVTVSDGRWKFIRFESGTEELYDLDADPHERDNVISSLYAGADAALDDLRSWLAKLAD